MESSMIRFPIPVLAALACCATSSPIAPDGFSAEVPREFRYKNTIDVGDVQELQMLISMSKFMNLAAAGEKAITLRIDSFGGGIFLGNRWVKALEDVKKRNGIVVTCIVDGAAYSMGAVILESPLCDVRLATTRSTILFHNGSSGAKGTAEDLREAAAFLDAINVAMALTCSERIGMTLADYKAKIAHADWMMAAPEAESAGVIDGIAHPSEIAPPA